MIFGLDLWMGIFIGALAVSISNNHSPIFIITISLTHTVEVALTAFVLRFMVRFNPRFEETHDVLSFMLVGILMGPVIGATLASISFLVSPEGQTVTQGWLWLHWWIAHVISILTLTPVLLIWAYNHDIQASARQWIEIMLAIGMVTIISVIIFVPLPDMPLQNLPLGHVLFPFLLWIALRFTPREVATAGFIASMVAIIGTVNKGGPFSRLDLNHNLLLLLTFVLSVVSMSLVISTILTQWRRARQALINNNMMLEQRVIERTREWMEANYRLQLEITERHQIEVELQLARDQALEALQVKSQILANISHDARTPLSIIMLYTDLFRNRYQDSLTSKQLDLLKTISLNTKELNSFIDNLLDQARLQTSKMEPKYETINPHIWFPEAIANLQPLAENKNLELTYSIDEAMPEAVYIDVDWLKHIHNNLVGNAFKFTRSGGVHVGIRRIDKEIWRFTVQDTGIGMSVEAMQNIFEPFWQVDASTTRESGRGVGLGLSIVKQLVGLLHGEISVNSQLGQGSIFIVTLPIAHDVAVLQVHD